MSSFSPDKTATYWTRSAPDGFGEGGWESPVTVNVKIVDRQSLVTTQEGQDVMSKKAYYTDAQVPLYAMIAEGTIADAEPTSDADEVLRASANPFGTSEFVAVV